MNIRLSIFKIKNLPFKIYIQILLLQFTAKKEIKTLKKAKKTSKFIKVEFNKEKDKFGIKDYLENFIKHFDFDKIKEYLFLDNNNLYNTIFTTTARTNIRNKNNINKVIIEIKDSDNDKEADKYDEDDENATISTIGSCSSNCKKMNEQSCQSKLIFKALNCSSGPFHMLQLTVTSDPSSVNRWIIHTPLWFIEYDYMNNILLLLSALRTQTLHPTHPLSLTSCQIPINNT
ncbi:hypothetical protein RCL_jg16390.t1 [Rhizophagus clarus]|uniref:Uncharacterized protein n=1 Tax=Rhizophagus clarus TaxID=94130 RepID=A0A8H3M000_9GLOM|nr:hypothetical protein RCL_jg16390.t1 [Rhizophagus clarus]